MLTQLQSKKTTVTNDVLSLTDQLRDAGKASTKGQEMPDRPVASTPEEVEHLYKSHRDEILKFVKDGLEVNELWKSFCAHPDAVIKLTVKEENWGKLNRRQYKIPAALMAPLMATLQRWIETGKVKKAEPGTIFNSPLLVVPKYDKNGEVYDIRVCVDVRQLNKYLEEDDKFEIPRIPDVLERFKGCKYFGEMDLSEAYFQFQIHPESQKYLAFTVEQEQYVFSGCPFGIKHVPSLYQRFMGKLFADMPFVCPYIDNLPFASKTWEEHKMHTKMIIDRLNSVHLRIKPSSLNIGNSQIRILGHLIDAQGVHLDPKKRETIMNWPLPRSGAELGTFLGLGTFLRDHIRHYADIVSPLHELTKQAEIKWDDHTREHFNLLKRAFATAPFLKYPDLNKRFVIACDASHTGIGGVLYQPDDADDTITADNIVAITSKKLTTAQRRYPVYKKELWAMISCLRKFHTYIWLRRDTVVHTDHKPLMHILNQQTLSVSLQQWIDVIMNYDLTIKYRPGIMHIVPDALSRMYAGAYADKHVAWGTHDNIHFVKSSQQHLSPSDVLCQQSIDEIVPPKSVAKRYRPITSGGGKAQPPVQATNVEPTTAFVRASAVYDDEGIYQYDDFAKTEHPDVSADDILDFEMYVQYGALCAAATAPYVSGTQAQTTSETLLAHAPSDADSEFYVDQYDVEHEQLVSFVSNARDEDDASLSTAAASSKLSYDETLALAQEKRGKRSPPVDERRPMIDAAHLFGHYGVTAIFKRILEDGFWWPAMYADITEAVKDCEQCQKFTVGKHGYHPAQSVHASLPGDHYIVDLMELPLTEDNREQALVLIDVFTGFVVLRALRDKRASTIARELWDIFTLIGPPQVIQSDRGTEFVNEIVDALMKHEGVSHRVISAYHPQADGKVERAIQTVRNTLNKLLHGASIYWPLYLSFVQLTYNHKISELTGSSPFSLMFGRKMNSLTDYTNVEAKPVNMDKWKQHQEEIISLIYPAIDLRSQRIQQHYVKKMDNMRRRVLQRELPAGSKVMILDPDFIKSPWSRPKDRSRYIGPFFIVRRAMHGPYILRAADGTEYERRVPIDQMKIVTINKHGRGSKVDDPDEYQVERILDVETRAGNKRYYLVKWVGYPVEESTWEPEEHLHADEALNRFYREKTAKRRVYQLFKGGRLTAAVLVLTVKSKSEWFDYVNVEPDSQE